MPKDMHPDVFYNESEDDLDNIDETRDMVGPIRNKHKTKCQPYPNTAALRRSTSIQSKQTGTKANTILNDFAIYTEKDKSSIAKHRTDSEHAID
ncbi:unnamed protein product [Didymodactylos carnosus]|uniref:Uncharacterized protein n=1 Tax=Didymodactylos carnosus TaxID=1234261 RepID=A0A816ARQ6_9BILA|nr:unnamed protein product [Didymodactylos carnosus]CAF4474272.1 unnamed protein product [Didymodactylos carnosus]